MSERPMLEGVRRGWAEADAGMEAPELYDGVRAKRALAFLIDLLILGALYLGLLVAGGVLTLATLGLASPLVALAWAALFIAYPTLTIGGSGRATLGMKALGLEAAATDGRAPNYLQAFIFSALFWFLGGATGWLILLVSLLNERGRCAHDFLAGLLIVRADARPLVTYASSEPQ
jgi:uncharacterized RDD family membrane protein YckC